MSPKASTDAALVDWKKELQRKKWREGERSESKEKGWTKRVALAFTLARWSSPSQLSVDEPFFFFFFSVQ